MGKVAFKDPQSHCLFTMMLLAILRISMRVVIVMNLLIAAECFKKYTSNVFLSCVYFHTEFNAGLARLELAT